MSFDRDLFLPVSQEDMGRRGWDFYDFLLKEALLKGPMKEAECIGTLLGVMPTGMRDYWWHNRIEKLIHQGDLCLLETSDRPYARTISLP